MRRDVKDWDDKYIGGTFLGVYLKKILKNSFALTRTYFSVVFHTNLYNFCTTFIDAFESNNDEYMQNIIDFQEF